MPGNARRSIEHFVARLLRSKLCVSTIGKICLTERESFTNQQINSLIVNEKYFDPIYIFYLLRTATPKIHAISGGSGSGKAILNKSSFENIDVKVHPLSVQRKIAVILSAYDDLIENNNRRIKILEEMAQTIYKEWFTYPFRGIMGTPSSQPSPSGRGSRKAGEGPYRLVKSELGMIPEGWEVEKLGDVCNILMGQSPKSEFYNTTGDGLPFHQGVKDFGRRFPTHITYCTVNNRIAETGDILLSVRAPVGRINIANTNIIIGRGLSAIRHREGIQSFLYYQLKEIFSEEDKIGSGAIFNAVTKDDLHKIKFKIPDNESVKKFNKLIEPIDKS